MSGIYIPGMEMPNLGDGGITIFVYPDGNGGNYIRWMDNNTSDIYAEHGEAVSVPPHGRLIDADKLYENVQNAIREYWNETGGGGGYYLAEDALKEICAAPTVIQASEEVYARYTDTAGNTHWTGTKTGEHIIPASKEGE